MIGKISVLICDDNTELAYVLKEYLNSMPDFDVAGVANDGLEALEMLKTHNPDIVILDIIMPGVDGIGVLEKLEMLQLPKKPAFIMISAIGQDKFIQRAITLGAEYYIVKPFDVQILAARIREVHKERISMHVVKKNEPPKQEQVPILNTKKKANTEAEVTNLISKIGIPPHLAGYQYIREAVLIVLNDESKTFNSITKVLYPSVAEKFKTTPQKVERAIRTAIESAYTRGTQDSMDFLFGYTINFSKGKPTNSEFIAMVADKVRLI